MKTPDSNRANSVPARLVVSVDGPKVGAARLSVADLAEILKRTQQVLKRVGRVLYGEDSQRQGRDKADIAQLCEVFLVGWQSGSAVADLELAEPPAQMRMFGSIGAECVTTFVTGMAIMASAERNPAVLPPGFDRGVLETCHHLARVLDHGIDQVAFSTSSGGRASTCTFNSSLRQRIEDLLEQPVHATDTVKTGRLEELNGHGSLTGRLWEPDGTKWVCHFRQEHLEQLPDVWMRTARVSGRAIIEEGKERILEVDSLIAIGEEIETGSANVPIPFWTSFSLSELAEQQGVSSPSDLEEISSLWPAVDDADDLLQHVKSERTIRRSHASEEYTS